MRAVSELSREKGGDFVSTLEILDRLGEDAISLGLSNALQGLEDQGFMEHRYGGTGGERPTAAGLAEFGLR